MRHPIRPRMTHETAISSPFPPRQEDHSDLGSGSLHTGREPRAPRAPPCRPGHPSDLAPVDPRAWRETGRPPHIPCRETGLVDTLTVDPRARHETGAPRPFPCGPRGTADLIPVGRPPLWLLAILAAVLLSAPLAADPPPGLASGPVPGFPGSPTSQYPAQFLAMGYLLYHCSSLNLIHGLNLDKTQIRELYNIARLVDALSPPPPVTFSETTGLSPILDTFRRLATALRWQRPIPESFRQTLFTTREEQSRLLRKGLRYDLSQPPLACSRCHWVPGARRLVLPWIDKIALHPGIRKEQALSHMVAPFGLLSFLVVAWHAGEIDHLLHPAQSAAVASFSCCLLPPRDFANPIRVGQADLGDWEIPALEKIRSASKWTLPFVKAAVRRFLTRRQKAINPGVTQKALDELTTQADALVDRLRALSDVDFELQKGTFARQFTGQAADPVTEKMKQLRTAMFLLMPGSSDVYLDLLTRPE